MSGLLFGITSLGFTSYKDKGIKTIVIDAGHGGHDSGCLGKNSQEKHIALKVALSLGSKINKKYPEIKIIYTRKTDVFVPLHKRANLANKHAADLFISIHCNATSTSSVFGTETFVMGLHKNDANLSVAKRENDVILKEDDHEDHYDGFDPNSPISHIVFQMYQNAYLAQSIHFASLVQEELKKLGKKNRGVKQAGFLVLYKTYMPSVLIETGFLTNLDEEQLLNSKKGQEEISTSIFNAFVSYSTGIDKHLDNEINITSETENIKAKTSEKVKDISIKNNDSNIHSQPESVKDSSTKKVNPEIKKSQANNSKGEKVNYTPDSAIKKYHPIYFCIQVASSSNRIQMDDNQFKNIADLREVKVNDRYKYLTGVYADFNTAINWQIAIRNIGFKDAFIIAFNESKQISLSDAKQLLQKNVRE